MVSGFSGGMKRKLSLGIALIGDPEVVFLDEPSSGMDPVSRRQMWEIIESAAKHRSVVLTSHHMEECEALCSKVAFWLRDDLHVSDRFNVSRQDSDKVIICTFECVTTHHKERQGRPYGSVRDYVSSSFRGAHAVGKMVCLVRCGYPWMRRLVVV